MCISPTSRNTADIVYDVPTESMFGNVDTIVTELGDDVKIFLTNGSVIIYSLESNPQAVSDNRPDEFRCCPQLMFFERDDLAKFDITGRDGEFDPVTIKFLS